MNHQFPSLPYTYDALEPYIDAKTMEVHYSKHHRTYFDKFITAITGTELENLSLEEIFASVSTLPAAIRNNGGGYYNHIVYWECMSPNAKSVPEGNLAQQIDQTFGGLEQFKDLFADTAMNTFGSGFVWLVATPTGELEIISTPNQDNPLMDIIATEGTPILALDVWEHAYYLSYQNKRPEYINAWWNVVDWQVVEDKYHQAVK